jgi:hypothetical protein
MHRVSSGKLYAYAPVLLDMIDGPPDLAPGDVVRVVRLLGCPPPNTMNHCHVSNPETGRLYGLVCCNSLQPYPAPKLPL